MRGNQTLGAPAALLGFVAVLALGGTGEAAVPVTDGLVVHLDAGAGVTQEATTGPNGMPRVSTWADQALLGGANNATQGTDAARPEYFSSVAALNNQPALHFFGSGPPAPNHGDPDGQIDHMSIPGVGANFSSAANLFIAAKVETDDPISHFRSYVLYSTGTNDEWWTFGDAGSGYLGAFRTARVGGTLPPGGAVRTGSHVFEIIAGTSTTYLEDGTVKGTPTAGTFAAGTSHMLANAPVNFSLEKAFEGYIAEVLVYDRPLTDDERNQVGYYLQDKYGIQGDYVFIPTDVIPEPATMLLLGVGVLGVLRRRR